MANYEKIKRTVGSIGSSLVDVYAAVSGDTEYRAESKPPAGARNEYNNNTVNVAGLAIPSGLLIIGLLVWALSR